jgi:uncharacterized protein
VKSSKPKLVVDTNVWISGLVFGGNCRQILSLFADELIDIVASEETLSELRRKITQRFPLYIPKLRLLEASIREDGQIVPLGSISIRICRDPDDDKFIETALLGTCNNIISGDQDLLSLKHYNQIKILSPTEFLKLIN